MRKLWFISVLSLSPLAAQAAWFGGEFSADVMAQNPQTKQWETRSKIYVGKSAMRMDTQQGYQSLINVLDAKNRTMYSINPSQQAYMQMPMPEGNIPMLTVAVMPGEHDSPCQADKISCRMVGEEQVNGVQTQKWEMVDERDPLLTLRSFQWLDPNRKMLIKSQEPGTASTELKYLGEHTIAGRKVEKWETTFRRGDQTQRTVSYIDPKLHVAVRLEAGNQILALNDIQEKEQPANLFQIPKNFRRVTPEEAQRSTGVGGMAGGAASGGQMMGGPNPAAPGTTGPGALPGR